MPDPPLLPDPPERPVHHLTSAADSVDGARSAVARAATATWVSAAGDAYRLELAAFAARLELLAGTVAAALDAMRVARWRARGNA